MVLVMVKFLKVFKFVIREFIIVRPIKAIIIIIKEPISIFINLVSMKDECTTNNPTE